MITLVHSNQSIEHISLTTLLHRSPYTIMYFYPKNDTPGCTTEGKEFSAFLAEFSAFLAEFAALQTQIVGVSRDSTESHCAFIAAHTLTPMYISDPYLLVHKQFSARGTKKLYGKDVEGVIRSTVLLNYDGAILKHRKNVTAGGHAARVLRYLHKHLAISGTTPTLS